jgi:hypothetical protein
MMLKELSLLLQAVDSPNAQKDEYLKAIIDDNCLSKNSGSTKKISSSHLTNMYMLDDRIPIFKALRYFWQRDKAGQPLLAFLCLYSRDYLIQDVADAILSKQEGTQLFEEYVIELLSKRRPNTFSKATLSSSDRNILSTFTQAGYVKGKMNKTRSHAQPTSGSAAYALFLGYLSGSRGETLFSSEFAKLLDCGRERVVDLAESASRSGWLSFKHIEDIYEITFPNKDLGVPL